MTMEKAPSPLHSSQPELSWPTVEIPGAQQEATPIAPVEKPSRLDLTDREAVRKERLEDTIGFVSAQAFAATTGRLLDPVHAAQRIIRPEAHRKPRMPSRGADGDTGLNDPHYAGSNDTATISEEALRAMHVTNEHFRRQGMEREINELIKGGMMPDKARNQVEAREIARQERARREQGR